MLLQKDIDALSEWSDKWLLKFNGKKWHVLTLDKIDNICHTHRYTLDGKELKHVFENSRRG